MEKLQAKKKRAAVSIGTAALSQMDTNETYFKKSAFLQQRGTSVQSGTDFLLGRTDEKFHGSRNFYAAY